MLGNGFAELGEHDRAGDPVVRGYREGVAEAGVQPSQDFAVGTGATAGLGEAVWVKSVCRHSELAGGGVATGFGRRP